MFENYKRILFTLYTMYMKVFLVALREAVKKDYSDIDFMYRADQNLYIWDSIFL